MKHKVLTVAVAGCALALLATSGASQASDRHASRTVAGKSHLQPAHSRYKRKRAARVRGFVSRGGYYSYVDADVINTYGGSRSLYGGTNFYRDPFTDRQTTAGPFDHDFFFDSGMGPRGGDAPYPR
jgi:hypothetical protein